MQLLREAIDGAGLRVCIRYDTMSRLAAFTGWYTWVSATSTGRVFDPETKVMVSTIEVPLSDAREMLQRAEQTLADEVYEALR